MPSSSSTSRSAACSHVSPSSTWPLGSDQSSYLGRWTTAIRPSRSTTPPAARSSGTERQPSGTLAEAQLDQLLLERRAEDRLAVDALDAEARAAAAEHELGERLERGAQVLLAERQQPLAAALDVERGLVADEHDERAADA